MWFCVRRATRGLRLPNTAVGRYAFTRNNNTGGRVYGEPFVTVSELHNLVASITQLRHLLVRNHFTDDDDNNNIALFYNKIIYAVAVFLQL